MVLGILILQILVSGAVFVWWCLCLHTSIWGRGTGVESRDFPVRSQKMADWLTGWPLNRGRLTPLHLSRCNVAHTGDIEDRLMDVQIEYNEQNHGEEEDEDEDEEDGVEGKREKRGREGRHGHGDP